MKIIFSILIALVASVSAFAQNPTSVYWIKSRVTDSTTVSYPSGWGVFYYNNQSGKWRICNGSGVCTDVGSGSGSGTISWGDIIGDIGDQTDLQDSLSDKHPLNTKLRVFTTNHTLQTFDAQKEIFMNSASPLDLTIPPNSSVALPLYTSLRVTQTGVGQLTIVEGVGVTVNPSSGSLLSPGQGALMELYQSAIDTWELRNGVAILPIDLTADVTGILPVPNGGTGLASVTSGRIPYGNGTSALQTSGNLTFNGTTFTVAADVLITPATNVTIGGNASASAEFRMYEQTTSGSNFTAHKIAAQSADITYTWPSSQGGASTVLTNNGSGGLSWAASASGTITTRNRLPSVTKTASFTLSKADTSKLIVLDGSADIAITLADFSTGPSMQFAFVRDSTQTDTVYFNTGGQAVQFSGGRGIPPKGFAYISYSQALNKFFVSTGGPSSGGGGGGSGTVTDVSVVTANGVSGSVATSTTTPAITLSLGAITPTSVNGVTVSGSSTPTLAVTGTTAVSGTNTGDQTTVTGNAGTATALQTSRTIGTLTGDATSAGSSFNGTANNTNAVTLATVNSNVGSFGSTTQVPVITVNEKGLVTAVSTSTVATSGTAWQLTGTSTLNAPILDASYATFQNNSLGGTAVANSGIRLENNTAAAVNAQQVSPAITWKGFGWKSDATTASRSVEFRAYVLPQQNPVNPIGLWALQSSINGGAFANCLTVNNAGNTAISGFLSISQASGSGQKLITASSSSEQFSVTQEGLVTIAQATGGLRIKEGTNASMGLATLVAGTVTVSNTRVTANSKIFLSVETAGGTQGILSYTKIASTSFTINSTSALDTSTVSWMIVEPAP